MSTIPVKIRINNKDYAMDVDPEDEELIRKAGKNVNERIKFLESTYRISDAKELAEMVALYSTIEKLQTEQKLQKSETFVLDEVTRLSKLASQ